MKNNVVFFCTSVFCPLFLVTLISLTTAAGSVRAEESTTNAVGITDAEICDVIARVAKHQVHPLAEGDYSTVNSVAEARAAKSPEGIIWNYPWGVTLYGVLRSTD